MSQTGGSVAARRDVSTSLVVAGGWIAWAVSPVLLLNALITRTPWFGGTEPSAAELRSASFQLGAAFVLGVVVPAVALVVATVRRRRVAAILLAVAVGLALVPTVALTAAALRESAAERQPAPVPPGYCAERSGGDTDCPGG